MLKYFMYTSVLGVAFTLSTTSIAQAQTPPTAPNNLIKQFQENGGKYEYLGKAYGMDGWLLINKENAVQYAYTNDQGATVMGVLFSPDGEVETKAQIEKLKTTQAPPPAPTAKSGKAETLYSEFEKSGWIELGSPDAPFMYTAIAMDSPKSKDLVNKLMPYIEKNQISLRVLPIATSQEGYSVAVKLLSSPEPSKVLSNFLIKGEKTDFDKIEAKEVAFVKLDLNAALAQNSSIKGVPFSIYRRADDNKIMAVSGVPENALLLVSDLQQRKAVEKSEAKPEAKAEEIKTEPKGNSK